MSDATPLFTSHPRSFETNRFVYPVVSRRSGGVSIGGETQRKWSNKLMRYRVLAQFIAIAIVLLVFWIAKGH